MWKNFVDVGKNAFFLEYRFFFFFFFKKSSNFFTGFRIHFFLKIGTLEMVKNRLAKNESEILFFEGKCEFLPKIAIFEIF